MPCFPSVVCSVPDAMLSVRSLYHLPAFAFHWFASPSPVLGCCLPVEHSRGGGRACTAGAMRDWAPSIIATALFALLCPGGVLQMPGRHRPVDLMNMKTSFPSMLVHAVIYFLLLMLFLVILQPHLYI
jgi:hypothetical protein